MDPTESTFIGVKEVLESSISSYTLETTQSKGSCRFLNLPVCPNSFISVRTGELFKSVV